MKIKIIVTVVLISASIASAFYPLKYRFADREIPPLPEYRSYENLMGDELPEEIRNLASEHSSIGYIIPVDKVEGDSEVPEYFKDDINIALAAYPEWKLLVSAAEREAMIARFDETVEKWGGMMSGRDFRDHLTIQKKVAIDTKYIAKVKIFDIEGPSGDDRKIILTINDEKTGTEVFAFPITFADPSTVSGWKESQEEQKQYLKRLEKGSQISLIALAAEGSILLLFYLVVMMLSVLKTVAESKRKRAALAQIEMREDLVNNGHYRAALELADTYLEFFTEDVEIKAFRQRLIVFTGGEPKKAEEAYVEAKKIKAFLENTRTGTPVVPLSAEEHNNISTLLPYNQTLKSSYEEVLKLEDDRNKEENFKSELASAKSSYNSGTISECLEKLSNLALDFPDNREIWNLKTTADGKREEAERRLESLKQKLAGGGIKETLEGLDAILNDYRDFKEALEIRNKLREGWTHDSFRLRADDNSRNIVCIFKKDVEIGREDENVHPDIKLDNNRISRPHLRLSIIDDKVGIEDLGSSGGTFINGERIESSSIKDGDLLTLAKVIDFEVEIKRKDGSQFVILKKGSNFYLISPKKIYFHPDLEKELVLIVHEKGATVICSSGKTWIVERNLQVTIGSVRYIVEEL